MHVESSHWVGTSWNNLWKFLEERESIDRFVKQAVYTYFRKKCKLVHIYVLRNGKSTVEMKERVQDITDGLRHDELELLRSPSKRRKRAGKSLVLASLRICDPG